MSQPSLTAVISPSSLKAVTSAPAFMHHSAHASMAHWRLHGGAEQASTFIARNNDSIVDLLLFRIEGPRAIVLNEMIAVDNAMVNRFAKTIFAKYPSVVRHAVIAARSAVDAASHRAKYWILEPERQSHPVMRAVVNAVKKIRRMGDRPA
jgi:hypothetical protein